MNESGKKTGELMKRGAVLVACKPEVRDGRYYGVSPLNNAVVTLHYLIGTGGQGDVYHVSYRGRDYALKWYCKEPGDVIGGSQFQTIAKIYGEEKKPGKEFIWPLVLVAEQNPTPGRQRFGYLMELLPNGFHEMEDFLKHDDDPKAARFSGYNARLAAGMNIAAAMQKLHLLAGYSYKDLNPKNFMIYPANGDVLIVDNDNVSVDGDPCSVRGMKGYMAPEIPRSGYRMSPCRETDYYSLAVILYRLFFIDHPMEGKAWEKYPIHTDKVEDYLYAIKPVFHLDPGNDSNRPTVAYTQNVMKRWRIIPLELRRLFIAAFTEGIDQPGRRSTENVWIVCLAKARDRLIRLNKEREQFVDFSNPASAPPRCLGMRIGENMVALYPQKAVYEISISGNGNTSQYTNIVGGIVYDKRTDRLRIRNLTEKIWRCYSPDTKQLVNIGKGQEHAVYPGVMIEFQHEPRIVGEIFDARRKN